MQKTNSLLIERMARKMQLRNYHDRTTGSYTTCMPKVQNFFIPHEKISVPQF